MLVRRRECALHLGAKRRHRAEAGPTVRDELHERQSLPGRELRCHGETGIVRVSFGPGFCATWSTHDVIHRGGDAQLALLGGVDEHRSSLGGGREVRVERGLDDGARAGIGLVLSEHRFVGDEL